MTLADAVDTLRPLQAMPAGAELGVAAESRVSAIAYDSRRVGAGSIFVALKGLKADGAAFVEQAMARGAIAIVSESAGPAGVTPPGPGTCRVNGTVTTSSVGGGCQRWSDPPGGSSRTNLHGWLQVPLARGCRACDAVVVGGMRIRFVFPGTGIRASDSRSGKAHSDSSGGMSACRSPGTARSVNLIVNALGASFVTES